MTIYEKEPQVGGRVNQIKTKDGFVFDYTAAILLLKQPLAQLYEDIDLKLESHLRVQELEVVYKLFRESKTFEFSNSLSQLVTQLEKKSPQNAMQFLYFLSSGYERFMMTNEHFLSQRFEYLRDSLNVRAMLKAMQLEPFKNSEKYVSSFKMDAWLNEYLLFQTMYVGLDPYKALNVYTILPVATQLYGITYIEGGLYEIVKSLADLILKKGGEIITSAPVQEVIVRDEVAVGVKVNEKEVYSDIVLMNADVVYANQQLLNIKKDTNLASSCSAFILHLGINKKLPQLDVHNIYLGEQFKQNIQATFEGELPKTPSFYIYCPSKIDSTMAPKGCESVSVTIRVPHLGDDFRFTKSDKDYFRAYIVKTLEKILKITNLSSHIVYESDVTPFDLLNRFNAYEGNAFGVDHQLSQINYLRPHHVSPVIKQLYYVGASTHPGTGIALVLKGAKLVVDEIISKN